MRKLVILRGIPGSGKTTWVKKNRLERYTLSPDKLFEMTESVSLFPEGGMGIDHSRLFQFTMGLYEEILEQRMRDGSFVVIDAVNIKNTDFSRYGRLAKKYGYEVICMDFSSVSLETCLKRKPAALKMQIKQDYKKMLNQKLPPNVKLFQPADFDKVLLGRNDLTYYQKIHHIGDIHGCSRALSKCLSDMKDDEMYIFCGDYINKGPGTAGVLQYLFDISDRPNVIFLEGNHEEHLRKWVSGEKTGNYEFDNNTAPQLEESGISKKSVRRFLTGLKECFWYRAGRKEVFICHGGVSSMAGNPVFIPSRNLINGCGSFMDTKICDDNFMKDSDGIIQIHGHRSLADHSHLINECCYSLEGNVEAGGVLRELVLDVESGMLDCIEYSES